MEVHWLVVKEGESMVMREQVDIYGNTMEIERV